MLSAVLSPWDSTLVAPAAGLGPSSAFAEVPVSGDDLVVTDEGLQFAASFLQQSGHAGHPVDVFSSTENPPLDDQLPSIDESLFDLLDVPDLEDVANNGPTTTAPLSCNQLFDDIPALENVPEDEVNWPSWTTDETTTSSKNVSPKLSSPPSEDVRRNPETVAPLSSTIPPTIKTFPFEEDEVAGYEEEVKSTEIPGYLEVGLASPASVYSAADSTTSSGIGVDCSPRFTSSDDPSLYSDKKRRASQASVSSTFYSSLGSPASSSGLASDSDFSDGPRKSKVGRKSRYTIEDRKERKKAQNRTAAERYRQKRRQAEEIISEEEQQLMDANGALRIEVTKLEAEVSCMKRLMREMLRAKGIEIPAAPPTKKAKLPA